MKSVHVGWSGWRRPSGFICDRRVAARENREVFQKFIETNPSAQEAKRKEAELEVEKVMMFRFSSGGMRMDKIKTRHIRGTSRVRLPTVRGLETGFRWFGCTETDS